MTTTMFLSEMDWRVAFIIVSVFTTVVANSDQKWTGCLSPQFLELGSSGILTCQFSPNFKAIFWFDNATFDDAQPVVTYKNKQKDGKGYSSGDYDIDSNGSLVIPYVTLQHEKMYKVLSFDDDDLYSVFRISVVVTVSPVQQKPLIDRCHVNDKCVIQANPGDVLKCSFTGARPPVRLEWHVWEDGREKHVNASSYNEKQLQESSTYETVSEIMLPDLSRKKLLWLICKSKKAGVATWDDSEVLVNFHGNSFEMDTDENETLYLEIEERARLDCPSDHESILLWNKCLEHQCSLIAFKKGTQTTVVEEFRDDFYLDVRGSLIIPSIRLFHDGNYMCFTSTPSTDISTAISLVVLVPPSPSYLVVAECSSGYGCTIPSTGEGTLTCTLTRVRPKVAITWITEDSQHVILNTIEKNSREELGLFDISVTINYEIVSIRDCKQTFKLECRAYGPATAIFYSRREVIIEQENCVLNASEKRLQPVGIVFLIVGMAVLCCVFLCILYGLWKHKYKRKSNMRRKDHGTKEEETPLGNVEEESDPEFKNMKNRLTQKLRLYYEKTFDGNGDGSFSRKNYVPNDLSFLNTAKTWNDEKLWEPLNSLEEIFLGQKLTNRHVIVESGVGYGKSTFAKYLAMQWCKEKGSLFSSCEILLFISLGHIGSQNLFDFTVSTLLQDEQSLTSMDVENIIRRTKNVWIILDDFHSYIDKSLQSSEIRQLLKEDNNNFKIIVLARPYCSLNVGDNQIPVVRLEPFNDEQIETFVSKKFTDKEGLQSRFLDAIRAQEDINSMCHVPLYLNIISSSYLLNGYIPPKVRTLTSFFTFIFNWLISKTKETSSGQQMTKQNPNSDTTFCYKTKIAKLAVDGLKTSTNLWKKSSLTFPEKDELLKVGILVETAKMERLSDSLERKIYQHVAFAHQIYQCYYGAHFLAYDEEEREAVSLLSSLDMKNCKYLFIFTCGLCKQDSLFKLIVQDLLSKTDYYPYSVNDCLAHCFYERRFLQTDTFHHLLQEMTNSEHRLHFRDGDDRNLLTAKAFVLETCAQLKIPVGILSFTNMVTSISGNYCFLKDKVKFSIPEGVQTFYIVDFHNKVSISNIMELLKNIKSVEEIIVYSNDFPKLHDEVEIPEGKENVKVIWISFKDNKVQTLNYPSINFKLWLNCHNTRTVKLLRKQEKWKKATPEKQHKMEMEILEEIKKKGFEKFTRNKSIFSQKEIDKLRKQQATDLEALRGFLKEFHLMYEAKTKEIYDEHRMQVREHIKKLTFADKLDIPQTSHDVEATDGNEYKYGKFDELVSGLKNYYQALHI